MPLARRVRRLAPMFLGSALTLSAAPSRAEDEARARELFERGRQLLTEGRIDDACDAFAGSTEEFSSSSGAWLNLALCREKQARAASAVRAYLRAAEVSERNGDRGKADAARRLASGLEPKVIRLTIKVRQRLKGQAIQLDGVLLPASDWGAALPIDPGEHVVLVSAPSYTSWSKTLQIDGSRRSVELTVASLAPIPTTARGPDATQEEGHSEPGGEPSGVPIDASAPGSDIDGMLVGGVVSSILGVGAFVVEMVAIGRVAGIANDEGWAAYRSGTPSSTDACEYASQGNVVPGAPAPSEIVATCDDASTWEAVEVAMLPLNLLFGILGVSLIAVSDTVQGDEQAAYVAPVVSVSARSGFAGLRAAF